MPRLPASLAETTLDSIANLWAAALSEGSITIRLPSRRAVFNTRNKLYAYRAEQRRRSFIHTGFLSSCYDPLTVSYREELGQDLAPTGFWFLQIGRGDFIPFELLALGSHSKPHPGPNDPNDPKATSPNTEHIMSEVEDYPVPTTSAPQPEIPDDQIQEDQVEDGDVEDDQAFLEDPIDADPS